MRQCASWAPHALCKSTRLVEIRSLRLARRVTSWAFSRRPPPVYRRLSLARFHSQFPDPPGGIGQPAGRPTGSHVYVRLVRLVDGLPGVSAGATRRSSSTGELIVFSVLIDQEQFVWARARPRSRRLRRGRWSSPSTRPVLSIPGCLWLNAYSWNHASCHFKSVSGQPFGALARSTIDFGPALAQRSPQFVPELRQPGLCSGCASATNLKCG